ncbi:hypothetical protein SO802_003854 [Lithocarpus litseifolius]|uniref:PB1 domain-containing protein n=1 Tax=Lithocarpus litseifolius TaxID=425828 RepID=A0AAW2E198_9ROSI
MGRSNVRFEHNKSESNKTKLSSMKDSDIKCIKQDCAFEAQKKRVVWYRSEDLESCVSLCCQLPLEDLDALVSITSDEDLMKLIEEFAASPPSSLKIRAFLSPPKPPRKSISSPLPPPIPNSSASSLKSSLSSSCSTSSPSHSPTNTTPRKA